MKLPMALFTEKQDISIEQPVDKQIPIWGVNLPGRCSALLDVMVVIRTLPFLVLVSHQDTTLFALSTNFFSALNPLNRSSLFRLRSILTTLTP
jgi:hypothetical protein